MFNTIQITKFRQKYFTVHIGITYSFSNIFGGSQDIAPIVRDSGLICTGNEATLAECTPYTFTHYRSICTRVAGVYCAGIEFSLF